MIPSRVPTARIVEHLNVGLLDLFRREKGPTHDPRKGKYLRRTVIDEIPRKEEAIY